MTVERVTRHVEAELSSEAAWSAVAVELLTLPAGASVALSNVRICGERVGECWVVELEVVSG